MLARGYRSNNERHHFRSECEALVPRRRRILQLSGKDQSTSDELFIEIPVSRRRLIGCQQKLKGHVHHGGRGSHASARYGTAEDMAGDAAAKQP